MVEEGAKNDPEFTGSNIVTFTHPDFEFLQENCKNFPQFHELITYFRDLMCERLNQELSEEETFFVNVEERSRFLIFIQQSQLRVRRALSELYPENPVYGEKLALLDALNQLHALSHRELRVIISQFIEKYLHKTPSPEISGSHLLHILKHLSKHGQMQFHATEDAPSTELLQQCTKLYGDWQGNEYSYEFSDIWSRLDPSLVVDCLQMMHEGQVDLGQLRPLYSLEEIIRKHSDSLTDLQIVQLLADSIYTPFAEADEKIAQRFKDFFSKNSDTHKNVTPI